MQIINSYSEHTDIRFIQQLRLYHLSRPHLRQWRQSRHSKLYYLDNLDQWIVTNFSGKNVTMVDCAGWYLEQFNIDTTCLESNSISKYYWPACYIEPDIFTHRPSYISDKNLVVFKDPWFLKYATVDQFVNFLNVWVKSTTVIKFAPWYIQHNHLKYNLKDLVTKLLPLNIRTVNHQTWIIET